MMLVVAEKIAIIGKSMEVVHRLEECKQSLTACSITRNVGTTCLVEAKCPSILARPMSPASDKTC